MCSDRFESVSLKEHLEQMICLKVDGIRMVMDEREKAAVIAAQALITKETQEQASKFALKKELTEKVEGLQNQLSGPLGFELRMRALEMARGTLDAKMYMILMGLSGLIAAAITTLLHYLFKG